MRYVRKLVASAVSVLPHDPIPLREIFDRRRTQLSYSGSCSCRKLPHPHLKIREIVSLGRFCDGIIDGRDGGRSQLRTQLAGKGCEPRELPILILRSDIDTGCKPEGCS